MTVHDIQSYELAGKHHWVISIIQEDGKVEKVAESVGYDTKDEMLKSLFGIFFGDYTETYLALYQEWNPNQQNAVAVPVGVYPKEGAPDPEQHMEELLKEKAGGPPWGDSDPAL